MSDGRRVGGVNISAVLLLVAIIIFVVAFFGVGPEGLWLIGLAVWASSQLV